MSERVFQTELRLKLTAWRDGKGFIENLSNPEVYFEGLTLEEDDRVIHVTLRVPASLWETPHIDIEVRSALQQMLDEIKGQAIERDA